MFYENKDFILQFTALVSGVGLEAIEVVLLLGLYGGYTDVLRNKDFILQFTALVTRVGLEAIEVVLLFG